MVRAVSTLPWRGLAGELASFGLESWSFYDKRVIRDHELENRRRYVQRGYHIGFLHRDSLHDVLHGNVTTSRPLALTG
jgi:hypothetical protein